MAISVIIPTLEAARHLPRTLAALVPAAVDGLVREVIVSDGGSTDATLAIAEDAGCAIVRGPKGRGVQLIAGAAAARGEWLLFLHADTALAPGWEAAAAAFMRARPEHAAAFRFAFDEESAGARFVAFWVGVRCALLKLPYGDQGLLIPRTLYQRLGGHRPLPLMEDVDLVRRIGGRRLALLKAKAVTSAERYRGGYVKRSLRNLGLIARYLLGADPAQLAREYER